MEKYISLNALVAEIERRKKICENYMALHKDAVSQGIAYAKLKVCQQIIDFINTLEVKEIPETIHTECKKIKKLCEIQRYDENGKAYSVMLPDTRLFMSKINDIIDVIDNINSRLLMVEQRKGE